ncbi:Dihydrofolate synthase @ Folylpolyglutamate synthase, partial [hydrothermal vent metagenome]
MNSYDKTLDFLINKLPVFQRNGPAAYKNTLGNALVLDRKYGSPHQNYKTIHIAGTNGKGSVSHMVAAILQKAGYKTGLYTSPHLKDFRERIRVDGKMILKEEVVRWVNDFQEKNIEWKLEPSFFELTVALAFDYFSQQNVDIAVIEVGLGGRLDSTNIIHPEISIITNIGLDHTSLLGSTPEEIAVEKAGIIKSGVPVIIGQKQKEVAGVFERVAQQKGASLCFAGQEFTVGYSMRGLDGKQIVNVRVKDKVIFPDLKLGLAGMYQLKNLPAVLKTVEVLKKKGWEISRENLYEGLAQTSELTGIMGRWQVIGYNPAIICDTGHNEDGIREVVAQINHIAYKKLHFVLGVVADKDPSNILALLPKD